jgi:hypothetical protein
MNTLQADLARAVIDARRATASDGRLAAQARRPGVSRRLLGRLRRSPVVVERPAATPIRLPRPTSITRTPPAAGAVLDSMLALVAERIVEHGTVTEARLLRHVSAAARRASPGAAAALVDWHGAEVARLRAFGVVHGVVLAELDPCAQASLLDDILGTDLSLAG